ncbi:hypothetical protein Q8791_03270 [Nocardiopsis sp. CT-R113]|uniref:DUF4232 domain-containing protein n=1 Tax=Nocardiopsis codii TaxID=3065942 RepID=A0ABU7K1W1_9ACTN|nr:hypothetical protein [Nocardiopsis sp. CT-R113]MEE2036240.1 hypothetical protein [Nocardiopsis sp. CT-R113]
MMVFAVIAFACRPSGEESGEPTRSEAGVDASASPSVPPEDPSAAESGEPTAEESEGAEESASPSPGDEESEGSGGGEGGGEGGGVAAPERAEDLCRPQDVVVTFDFAEKDQEVYGAGSNPGFKITVVNTAEQTCTVDVGGAALEVRIHSGDDRIYSTADCLEDGGTEERQLSRGVPHEFTVDWERNRSFTDCRETSSTAQAGWYRANLHGDYAGNQSQLPFQLKA